MLGNLRKHVATFVVAAITAGTMALVMGGGAATASHVGTVYYRREAPVTIEASTGSTAETDGFELIGAKCPRSAPRAIGGGFYTDDPGPVLNSEYPANDDADAGSRWWAMWIRNDDTENSATVRPYVICLHGNVNRNYSNGANPATVGSSAEEGKLEE